MNTFGNIFRLTSFGESHGQAVGGVIDGCPPGIELDIGFIQNELDRRRPGQSSITTLRKEEDKVSFLSGVFEGKTTGTPIAFTVTNKDQNSSDYGNLKDVYRPSHADYTFEQKYGVRDYRGGVDFKYEKVGDVPAEMFSHFFKSFSDSAKCNLNIKAEGDNQHHKIEAIFKAFAKAIKNAVKIGDDFQIPSTKGVL